MKTTIETKMLDQTRSTLSSANRAFNKSYPGESDQRQPVHTVYGGAHLFKADTAKKIGEVALKAFQEFAPDSTVLSQALAITIDSATARKIHARIVEKLKREPVEDFRVDFEDGYGNRPDAEEDGHAESAAVEVAKGFGQKTLPPFIGIRIKSFTDELFNRSSRTLDVFLSTLLAKTDHEVPANFVVTLPKVTITEQVTALCRLLTELEVKNGLRKNSLKLELMVETPQSIISADGRIALSALVAAAEGRCMGAHFGTYDYTASCNITAAYQSMTHPACDFAKHVMQVSLAGTGVMLSDGATTVMPIGPHRAAKGVALSREQMDENRKAVHRAWKLGYDNIRHSLEGAFYQGWDLHPAQLPIRYAAVYTFFAEGLAAASLRLKAFVEKAAQATLVGDVFDDAATGQGLLNFFLRGIGCGAITEEEAQATGLSLDEIRTRSFLKILERRRLSPAGERGER